MPSGSEMVFRPGRISSAYKVEAVAYPYATASKALQGNPAATKTIDSSRRSLKTHGSGIERTIPAEVPPGEYVVLVDLTVPREKTKFWDDNGAEYGFRIMVE